MFVPTVDRLHKHTDHTTTTTAITTIVTTTSTVSSPKVDSSTIATANCSSLAVVPSVCVHVPQSPNTDDPLTIMKSFILQHHQHNHHRSVSDTVTTLLVRECKVQSPLSFRRISSVQAEILYQNLIKTAT